MAAGAAMVTRGKKGRAVGLRPRPAPAARGRRPSPPAGASSTAPGHAHVQVLHLEEDPQHLAGGLDLDDPLVQDLLLGMGTPGKGAAGGGGGGGGEGLLI